MTRRDWLWFAPVALTLAAPPARAQFGNVRKKEEVQVKEDSGYIWGYLASGALASAIIFAVCKPAHRELNTPKHGSTGPGIRK